MSEGTRDRLILGTAGHIDHGKTTLVRALTGVDCDRLPEEKERGITISLGFAPLKLPSGIELSIVDVPGHEGLVRTMVAGATGIDLVLFVIAADEGIMPQSREHLAICDLLGISSGVVALTKIDSVDSDLIELAQLEIADELAGTCLAEAPILPVSAQTGQGIPELIETLERLASAAPPRTLRDGPAWLPVDRVFTQKGFGTIVTGTLRGASLNEGQQVEILADDGGRIEKARVRGLQVHGESAKSVRPGARCAVNLQGVEVSEVGRGSVLATQGRVDYRPRVEVELRLLPGAPGMADGASVTAHLGTSVRRARVALLDCERLEPGGRAMAELRFDRPVPAVEGDRFILRGFGRIPNAGWTVGGGRILDAAPSRARRTRAERVADLRLAALGDEKGALAARLRRAGIRGATREELLRERRSLEALDAIEVGGGRYLDPDALTRLRDLAVTAVKQHHDERPTDPWVGFATVRGKIPGAAADESVRAALRAACDASQLESGTSGFRDPAHQAHAADSELALALGSTIREAGLAPDTLNALATSLGTDARALRPVLEHLVREDQIVRVSSDMYFARGAIDDLQARLVAYLQEHGQIDPAGYKQLTGQSRKHTVPLMEYFDAQKVTLRRDNIRLLR